MPIPHLPAELLDHVVDHLRDTKDALSNCCLVSKSWIPRTREHIFANVRFRTKEDLESWKETFPNPSTSPARYTKSLQIKCLPDITAADAEPGGWIRDFSHVVHFRFSEYDGRGVYLLPFHGFSSVLKSLRVEFYISPPTFDFILSFPLLEDLAVNFCMVETYDGDGSDGLPTVIQPSDPPMFTGSLELVITGLKPFIRQLLSLPGGIHFRKFAARWSYERDILPTTSLVGGCSHTLESLRITREDFGASIRRLGLYRYLTLFPVGSAVLDLSRATKLQDVDFLSASLNIRWITAAIRTTTPKHRDLRKISIHVPYSKTSFDTVKRSANYQEWLDLDRLLVQIWESHSTSLRVICTTQLGQPEGMIGLADCLLPELTRRGRVDSRG